MEDAHRIEGYKLINTLAIINLLILLSADPFINRASGQESQSVNGEIIPPKRIVYRSFTPNDSAKNKVIIISCRRPQKNEGQLVLSNNKPSRKGYLVMVAEVTDDCITIDTISSIKQSLSYTKNDRNTLFFVHGYGKSFINIVGYADRLSKRYQLNVIVFDWPSKCGTFNRALINVRATASLYSKALEEIKEFQQQSNNRLGNVTLMMHSLGNYYYIRSIKNNRHTDLYTKPPLFSNVVFNSAAIKQKHHSKYLNSYIKANNIYIIQNKNDYVLRGAELLMLSIQLGRFAHTHYAQNAIYIDFTQIAMKYHTFFLGDTSIELEHPFFYRFYNVILNGQTLDVSSAPFLISKNNSHIFEVVDYHGI